MTLADYIAVIVVVGWLVGVGLMAHAFTAWLNHSKEVPDFMRMGIDLFAERVAFLLTMICVAWPVAVPAIVVMSLVKKGK